MTKTIYTLTLFFLLAISGRAQVVSQFTWDTNPVTQAFAGPDATSSSAAASSVSGGAGGSNGLSPKGGGDINLVMAGSTFSSMTNIDISIDFLKRENGASFFTFGNFDFGIATGAIYIKYMVNVGGTPTQMTYNSQYTVSDVIFHTYRFVYNDVTGIATFSVDGTVQHTYTTTAGSPLVFPSTGNATIGSGMDGSGSSLAELDNLLIQKVPVVLPLELLSFEAAAAGKGNQLSWKTTRESGVRDFSIERSADGVSYATIAVVAAQQGYASVNAYQFMDNGPLTTSYYRLRMTDVDGNFSYSPVKKVNSGGSAVVVSCYPNPVVNTVNVKVSDGGAYRYSVVGIDGKVLQAGTITGGQASVNVVAAPKGMLIVRVENGVNAETFKLFKQ